MSAKQKTSICLPNFIFFSDFWVEWRILTKEQNWKLYFALLAVFPRRQVASVGGWCWSLFTFVNSNPDVCIFCLYVVFAQIRIKIVKKKLSRYTLWRRLGGDEVLVLLILKLGTRWVPAALYPRGKDPWYPLDRRLGGPPEPVWTQRLEEKFSASVGDRTPVIQSVVRHYTDWAAPAPN
jgi:hypothetical protein